MNEHKKVFIVFKTHFDIGYTELAEEVIERYGKKMLPDVVKTCETTQKLGAGHQYVWTMSTWPLIQSLNPEYVDENIIERAKSLIKNGQINWHLLPFTTHTEFCGLEEYIRGMYFSKKLSEEYGRWPVSAKMTDVPGHTKVLPSLLYKAGVRFLHLGCNSTMMPPAVPMLFYWEGPDGNRILTFYSKGAYGTALTPPKDWLYPVWLALQQTNDNVGPQSPEVIEGMIREAEEKMPGCEVIVGTMDDFYNALSEYTLDVPVVRGDLADTWIHGVGTYPEEVSEIRALRHTLVDIEKLLSIGMLQKEIRDRDVYESKKCIDSAFEQCILFGEHTWGLNLQNTLGYNRHFDKKTFLEEKKTPIYKTMERSWDEQRERVQKALAEVQKAAPGIMEAITAAANVDGARVMAFNGLGWKRDGWVSLNQINGALSFGSLVDADTGEATEISDFNGSPYIYAKDMPAFGYKVYTFEKDLHYSSEIQGVYTNAHEGILENKWFRVEVDSYKGTIKSLKEKATGKEWVGNSETTGFGKYIYDIYGMDDVTELIRAYTYRFYVWVLNDLGRMNYPEQEHLVFTHDGFSIRKEAGKHYASLIVETEINDDSVTEYGNTTRIAFVTTLYDNLPYIDLEFYLTGKVETPFIEAGHFAFPFNLKHPMIRINKLGSVIDPAVDIAKDANNLLYCCENWVDLSDGENGIAVIPFDTPLFSIGDKAIYKYGREYKESEPTLYFNAFNNSWGTNFPQWMGGDYKFKYRLYMHTGDWKQGEVWKHAMESVNPMLASCSDGINGKKTLPVTLELIKEMDGMGIQAFKPAENGDGFILRLRELKGESRPISLSFNMNFDIVAKCDLIERVEEILDKNTAEISFQTKPYEIHTYYLKTGGNNR